MPEPDERPSETPAVTPAAAVAVGADASAAPRAGSSAVPVDPATGEPRRPWTAWAALVLFFAAAGVQLVALLASMWSDVRRFGDGSWLNRAVPTALGDPFRILLVLAVWASAIAVGAAASIAGYYGWAGYAWTRWAGLVAVVVGGLSFLGYWLAPWSLVPLGLGVVALWLPPTRRWFAAWTSRRHPPESFAELPERVVYGPLPRYR